MKEIVIAISIMVLMFFVGFLVFTEENEIVIKPEVHEFTVSYGKVVNFTIESKKMVKKAIWYLDKNKYPYISPWCEHYNFTKTVCPIIFNEVGEHEVILFVEVGDKNITERWVVVCHQQ